MRAARAAGPNRGGGRLLSAAMLGVASGAILVPLNSTMLAVALPGVMTEFALGADRVSSLVTLYLGAVAVTLPAGGALGDRFGHRRTFLVGVGGFGAASLAAALAQTFEVLEAARVMQAVTGALISTASASLIRETAPEGRHGEAFGLFDLLTSSIAAIGPFIGGVVVAALGWRSLFFLAAPVAIMAAALVGIVLGRGRAPEARHAGRPLDLVGLGLLALVIIAFLLALRGEAVGGLATVGLVSFGPLLVLFVAVELRTSSPAVDPRLLARRPFAAAVASVFAATVVLHGCFVLVPLLNERVLAGSPTTSGIVLLGIAGIGGVAAPLAGRASDRVGRRPVAVLGSLLVAAGLAVLWLPGGSSTPLSVGLLLGVVGLGLALAGAPRQAAAFESIEPSRLGMASGTYYTGRYLGGVLGASLAGAVLGTTVTASGASLGFGLLALVALAGAGAALWLPARGRGVAAPMTRPS